MRLKDVSASGSSKHCARTFRALLVLCLFGLGGCWGGDLAHKNREVRASWAAMKAADSLAISLAERLDSVWRRTPEDKRNSFRFAALRSMNRSLKSDPGDREEMARYGAARAQLLTYLHETTQTLASPASAGLAWKFRVLRKECNAALLRSDGALRSYNLAAEAYNQELDQNGAKFSRALLYPGKRQFALLSDQ